jgi:hypothetical protein
MTFSEVGTGAVLVMGLVSMVVLRRRGRSDFQPTGQVARDEQGHRLRLYVDRRTGDQQWREEPERPPPDADAPERSEDPDSSS